MKLKSKIGVLKSLGKLYLKFCITMAVFIAMFNFEPVRRALIAPFTHFVAWCSGLLMNIFGAGSNVVGTTLSTSAYTIDVIDGCNGIYATAIFISGVIAYPAAIKSKLWGMVLGFIGIFLVNLLRVISLFYLGQHSPQIFEEVHLFVWQPIIIVWAVFIWDFWSRRASPRAAR